SSFRGFAGTIAAGSVAPGDAIAVLPGGQRSTIARIVSTDRALQGVDLPRAVAGQAVVLALADDVDASRGDVIAAATDPCGVADQFAAHVLWLGSQPLLPGRPYWLRIGTRTVGAQVTAIKHKVDVDTQEALAAKSLEPNEVGYCNLYLDQAIPFESYA